MRVNSEANKKLTKVVSDSIEKEVRIEKLETKLRELEIENHEMTLRKNTLEFENGSLKKQLEKLENQVSEIGQSLENRGKFASEEISRVLQESKLEKETWEKLREC